VLAGPANEYFERVIRPHVDARTVRYAGYVDRDERDHLLGKARALLYPVLEPEPFGLVQVEAMMCGTPVVAPAIGAVREVVLDGVVGATVSTAREVAAGIERALCLDRTAVRRYAIERFAARSMAEAYVAVYTSLVQQCSACPQPVLHNARPPASLSPQAANRYHGDSMSQRRADHTSPTPRVRRPR
jgi:glycosyltransferase involved in cell wall biosynthesis